MTALKELLSDDFVARAFVSHRVNSANYQRGEYLQAYKGAQDLMEEITKRFEEAKESNSADLEDIEYVMLKEQVFVAKCLNKLKDFTKAEDVCDDVIEVL